MDAKIQFICGKRGSGKTTLTSILAKGKNRTIIIDPLEEYERTIRFYEMYDIADYLQENYEKDFRISIICPKNVDAIFELCWIIKNVTIVIEEVDIFCNPQNISEAFGNCIRRGRHRNIEIIANTRRPAEVNRLLTSQATDFYCFQNNEPADISYLQKYTNQDFTEIVKGLNRMNFLHYPSMQKGSIVNFSSIKWR